MICLFIVCMVTGNSAEDQPQPTPPVGETPPQVSPPTQPDGVKGGEMVKVPAGEFIMGSDSGEPDEKPVRRIYLAEFSIDKYEGRSTYTGNHYDKADSPQRELGTSSRFG